MDDLEITRRCAKAMGVWIGESNDPRKVTLDIRKTVDGVIHSIKYYDPLHDDAQAMALVKQFRIDLECCSDSDEIYWSAYIMENGHVAYSFVDPDLNRAICLAVAMREME